MHTSGDAACGRDGGAPELCVRHSLRNSKIKETRRHVNERILPSAIEIRGLAVSHREIDYADQSKQYFKYHAFEFPV
jgi:hypothetical protein